MPETPEDRARKNIDDLLEKAGWLVQDRDAAKAPAGRGVALGTIAILNPPSFDKPPSNDEVVSFVPMPAVEPETGRLDSSNTKPWCAVNKGYTRFQEGDVLFAKITPCMENGKFALAIGLVGGRGAGPTEFHVLRPSEVINAKLLLYFLLRSRVRQEARLNMKGAAGQLRVPPEFLAQLSFPLPPEREQRRIVAEIEKQFTRLDVAVAALKRLQVNLKRYRASVLKAACEGRLVPTEAELARAENRPYEPADQLLARIREERRARWEADQLAKMQAAGKPPKDDEWKVKYKEPATPDETNLPMLPAGWLTASLEQLTSGVRVICYGILMPKENVAHGVPYVRVVDMKHERIALPQLRRTSPEIAAAYARASLRGGDLLLAIRGTFGRVAEVPAELDGGNITQDTARLDVTKLASHRYIALCLRSWLIQHYFLRVARGVAVKGVNIADVKTCPVMLPPASEQHRIVVEVERRLSVIDELEATVEANLKRAGRPRQSVLKRAFEGKLVPQDPTDEPASMLLERIRAARKSDTATPGCANGFTATPGCANGFTATPGCANGFTATPGCANGFTATPGCANGYTATPGGAKKKPRQREVRAGMPGLGSKAQ